MNDFPWQGVLSVMSAIAVAFIGYRTQRATARAQADATKETAGATRDAAVASADVEAAKQRTAEWSKLLEDQRTILSGQVETLTERVEALEGTVGTLRDQNERLLTLNETMAREIALHLRTIAEQHDTIAQVVRFAAVLFSGHPDPSALPSPPLWIESHPAWAP